jgi:hypothetical protein
MLPIPDNRRIFNAVVWCFAGICLLILVTSCAPIATAEPVIATPSQAPTIAVTTAAAPIATPTLTPTPTDKPNKCRLDKGGRRIADCIRKGVKP